MNIWSEEITRVFYGLKSDPLDDIIDRFNYIWTVAFLIFFAFLTGTKQHFGKPLQCMVPFHFPDAWDNYIQDYCFVSNTYSLNMSSPLSDGQLMSSTKREVVYYQWVPYAIVVQALLFFIPKIFWNLMVTFYGMDMRSIVEETAKLNISMKSADRDRHISQIASFVVDYIGYKRLRGSPALLWGGHFASIVYVITKWLFVAVTALQLFLINWFVGDGDIIWGYRHMSEYLGGNDWKTSGIFPRVTFCDIEITHIAQTNTYLMQCVLMMNLLNEKIYFVIWVWLICLMVINILSATRMTAELIFPYLRFIRVCNWLKIRRFSLTNHELRYVAYFVHGILKADGVLLLSFVNNRAGGILVTLLSRNIWLAIDDIDRKREEKLIREDIWRSPRQVQFSRRSSCSSPDSKTESDISTSSIITAAKQISYNQNGIDAFAPSTPTSYRRY